MGQIAHRERARSLLAARESRVGLWWRYENVPHHLSFNAYCFGMNNKSYYEV
jgi:hypothetical protein